MLVSAANQILVDAAKDLQRGGTVDGTQFSTGFWRPNDRDSFRCCFFAHFSSPNSRRISSCGMPSPRASDVRARSIAAVWRSNLLLFHRSAIQGIDHRLQQLDDSGNLSRIQLVEEVMCMLLVSCHLASVLNLSYRGGTKQY